MNKLIVVATGSDGKYNEMSLNLALTVKDHCDIPLTLVTTEEAAKHIDSRYFNELVFVKDTGRPFEDALSAKLMVPELVKFDQGILLDADSLVTGDPTEWFNQLKGGGFTAYCNDIYKVGSGKRETNDYHFWFDPQKAMSYYGLRNDIPQINASFLHMEGEETRQLFCIARRIRADRGFLGSQYRGSKTEEHALNVACSITGLGPKKVFRPVDMSCYGKEKSMGIAMSFPAAQSSENTDMYNDISNAVRYRHGLKKFKFNNKIKN